MTEPADARAPRRRGPGADGSPQERRQYRSSDTASRPPRSGARTASPPPTEADAPPARRPAARGARKGKTGKATPEKGTTERANREPPVRGPGGRWPMADRSVLPTVLGVPPVAAVGLAAALTAIGVLVDLTMVGGLGMVFTICHITGCVLAVMWVRRTGLFGPIVQPPLLVALSVPAVVLLAGSPRPGQGVAERLLVIGAPLVNAFPVMASTTGIVLVLGLLRVFLQRPV
jgi:hypothetical protein